MPIVSPPSCWRRGAAGADVATAGGTIDVVAIAGAAAATGAVAPKSGMVSQLPVMILFGSLSTNAAGLALRTAKIAGQ